MHQLVVKRFQHVIVLFVTDTMQSPVNLILVACVCVVVSMAMPCWSDPLPSSGEIASRPTRPKVFTSPDQLRNYLQEIGNYYAIEGRPRCVRRESFVEVDHRGILTLMYCGVTGQYLGSSSLFNFEQNSNKVHRTNSHLNKVHRNKSHLNKVNKTKSHLNKIHRTKSYLNKVHRTESQLNKIHRTKSHLNKVTELSHTLTKYTELSHTSIKYTEPSHTSIKYTELSHNSIKYTELSHTSTK